MRRQRQYKKINNNEQAALRYLNKLALKPAKIIPKLVTSKAKNDELIYLAQSTNISEYFSTKL